MLLHAGSAVKMLVRSAAAKTLPGLRAVAETSARPDYMPRKAPNDFARRFFKTPPTKPSFGGGVRTGENVAPPAPAMVEHIDNHQHQNRERFRGAPASSSPQDRLSCHAAFQRHRVRLACVSSLQKPLIRSTRARPAFAASGVHRQRKPIDSSATNSQIKSRPNHWSASKQNNNKWHESERSQRGEHTSVNRVARCCVPVSPAEPERRIAAPSGIAAQKKEKSSAATTSRHNNKASADYTLRRQRRHRHQITQESAVRSSWHQAVKAGEQKIQSRQHDFVGRHAAEWWRWQRRRRLSTAKRVAGPRVQRTKSPPAARSSCQRAASGTASVGRTASITGEHDSAAHGQHGDVPFRPHCFHRLNSAGKCRRAKRRNASDENHPLQTVSVK